MAKQYKMAWRDSDKKELQRVVKNFNSKLARLEKQGGDVAKALPKFYNTKTETFSARLSAEDLINQIGTRADYKRELNALKRFSRKGAEKLVKAPKNAYDTRVTKWQKDEMTRRIGAINKRRANRLERLQNIELEQDGKKLGYKLGDIGMGKQNEIALRPMKAFTPSMSRADINMKFRGILAESQSDYFTKKDIEVRENYIKGLERTYAQSDIGDVIEKIKSMPLDDFLQQFNKDSGTFEFASALPSQDLYEGYVEHLKSAWLPNKQEG